MLRRHALPVVTILAAAAACKTVPDQHGASVRDDATAAESGGHWRPSVWVRDLKRPPRVSTRPLPPGTEEFVKDGVVVGEKITIQGNALNTKTNLIEDDTKTFTMDMPQGGWWVTPIHTTLLADTGKILVTGWGRQAQENCNQDNVFSALTMGMRRYTATFLVDPDDLPAKELTITPIKEGLNPDEDGFQRQALYCGGHTLLADGRVLYTGGSKWNDLGVKDVYRKLAAGEDAKGKKVFLDAQGAKFVLDPTAEEEEFGMDYAKVYDPVKNAFVFESGNAGKYDNSGPFAADPATGEVKQWNTIWYPTNTRLPDGSVVTNSGFYRYADEFKVIKAFGLSEFETANRSIQRFDPAAFDCHMAGKEGCGFIWKTLSSHDDTPREIKPGLRDYIHAFSLYRPVEADGKKFLMSMAGFNGEWFGFDPLAGPPGARRFFRDPVGKRPYPFPIPLLVDRQNFAEGSDRSSTSLLLPTGEILTAGGSDHAAVSQRIDIFNPYQSCENYADLGVTAPCKRWRHLNTGVIRNSGAATLLPDGSLFLANGYRDTFKFANDPTFPAEDPKARMRPLLIAPAVLGDDGLVKELPAQPRADKFGDAKPYDKIVTLSAWDETNPADAAERGYHSQALLLKDGSLYIGGGVSKLGGVGCERANFQIYKPPYFDKPRPAFVAPGKDASLELKVGGPAVKVTIADNGIALKPAKGLGKVFGYSGVVLMAPGSYTHGFNQNQRYVGLHYERNGDELTITPPADGMIAPPGPYVMYLVNKDGSPSAGLFVNLKS